MERKTFLKRAAIGLPSILFLGSSFTACNGDELVSTDTDKKIQPVGRPAPAPGDDELKPIDTDKKILIIGAGIAGLSAAKYLLERGVKTTVLESQEKHGGRLRTDRSHGVAFDEGASWIHGPKENPITAIATAAGAKTFLTDPENLKIYKAEGSEYSEDVTDSAYTLYKKAIKEVALNGSKDSSFLEGFNRIYPGLINDPLWKYQLSSYLEFDTGGDIADLSSTDYNNDEKYSGDDQIITNGYDTVTDYLAKGLDIRLNERVSKIDYSGTEISVTSSSGVFAADYLIVTLPLGVLKKKPDLFSPFLPASKRQAVDELQMGGINKFLCVWKTAFWDTSLHYVGYASETKGKFSYFLNTKPFSGHNALMAFAFGHYSLQTESMTDAEVVAEIMENLKNIYGAGIPQPSGFLRTKWSQNPNTYGSYSFVAKGASASAYDALAEPVERKLFFAGEHTSRLHRGTVHGAYESGQREAEKIETILRAW